MRRLRYLKSDLNFLGVSVPAIRSAVRDVARTRRELDRDGARFEQYATPMLAEKEFFISKAIGWVLRETAKKDPAYVAPWTRGHLDQMSGVTSGRPSAGCPLSRPPGCRPHTAIGPHPHGAPSSSRTRFSVFSVKIQTIQSVISPFA